MIEANKPMINNQIVSRKPMGQLVTNNLQEMLSRNEEKNWPVQINLSTNNSFHNLTQDA